MKHLFFSTLVLFSSFSFTSSAMANDCGTGEDGKPIAMCGDLPEVEITAPRSPASSPGYVGYQPSEDFPTGNGSLAPGNATGGGGRSSSRSPSSASPSSQTPPVCNYAAGDTLLSGDIFSTSKCSLEEADDRYLCNGIITTKRKMACMRQDGSVYKNKIMIVEKTEPFMWCLGVPLCDQGVNGRTRGRR